MPKTRRRLAYALCISVAAMTGLLSAPAVWAEDGHHGGGQSRGDEHHVVTTPAAQPADVDANEDVNEDVNDDNGVDAAQVHMEDVFDDND